MILSHRTTISSNDMVTIKPSIFKKVRGRALVSYIKESAINNPGDINLTGHSNRWESKEVINTFVNMGYITDVINWDDSFFVPKQKYDVIFDIYTRFYDWREILSESTIKLLHLTGSYPKYQNKAELREAKKFEIRTKIKYELKRQVARVDEACKSINLADHCSLLGNKHTLSTYPSKIQKKITLLSVSASLIKNIQVRESIPNRKNYLWFFGSGSVHKGLDKLVEVFLSRPDLNLNIIGNIEDDKDFWLAYEKKISESKNIKYHGFIVPTDQRFENIVSNCFCFIAPSCSESMSTSVATCLQLGLYPIITRETGITLVEGCGIYLDNTNIQKIVQAISRLEGYSNDKILKEITKLQKDALYEYSRSNFSSHIQKYLKKALT